MTSNNASSLGQHVLNKAVEIGLSSQLDANENVDVDVRIDPLKLAQGEVDSVVITGDGLVIQQGLRLEELTLQTGSVAINLLSAIFGKIELTKPTEAKVRVVLTEADINYALNSEFIRNQLRNLEVQALDKTLRIDIQQAECRLLEECQVEFVAEFLLSHDTKTYPVSASLILAINDHGKSVSLQRSQYAEQKDLPIEMTAALLTKASELLNQRYYAQKDFWLHIEQIDIEVGKVILHTKVHVEQVPL